MNYVEYRADSVREALNEIRRDLGPDAIIVDQNVDGRQVVVRACTELVETPAAPARAEAPTPAARAEVPPASAVPEAAAARARVEASAVPARFSAPAATTQAGALAPAQPDPVAAPVEPEAPAESDWSTQLAFVSRPISELRGRYRFVGAPGVGKTSFLLKVAAEWVLYNAPTDLLILTTDDKRLAGAESVYLAAEILGVRVKAVGADQLDAFDAPLVLIDTAGHSAGDRSLLPAKAEDILVISALHRTEYVKQQIHALDAGGRRSVAVSSIDQALDAALLTCFSESGLPLRWLGVGPSIADGIEVASRAMLNTFLGAPKPANGAAIELTV